MAERNRVPDSLIDRAIAAIREDHQIAKRQLCLRVGFDHLDSGFLITLTNREPRIYETDGGMLAYDEERDA